jgi:CRISPR/Cas system-associated exonuclease Cas4 (RecB family)
MADIKISATRINTFLQCKQKYWFNYMKHLPKVSNPVFRLGLACHEALELAGKIWMEKGEFSAEDKKNILKRYEEVAIKEGIEEMSIHLEGKDLVKKRINDFDMGKKIIGLEIEFGMNDTNMIVTEHGVPLVGAIDKAIEVDEDTLLIVDYKTSKTAPTPDQLKTDKQLSIYDLVGSMLFPQYSRIIVSLDMLKHDMIYSYRTKEEREEFSLYLKEVYDQMCALKESEAKPALTTFCGWCDFRDYCECFKDACTKFDFAFKDISALDNEQVFNEWQYVRDLQKTIGEREKELASVLMDKVKYGGDNLRVGNQELYLRQMSRKSFDFGMVSKVVPKEHLLEMVDLNQKAVVNYMDRNPALRDRIANACSNSFTNPFLATKKVK